MDVELAPEWEDAGWGDLDLLDVFDVIDNALDYMEESGYF